MPKYLKAWCFPVEVKYQGLLVLALRMIGIIEKEGQNVIRKWESAEKAFQ